MRIGLLIFQNRDGGVERSLVNLSEGLAEAGSEVDLVVSHPQGPFLDHVHERVGVIALGADSRRLAQQHLTDYVRTHRPDVIVTGKPSDDRFVDIAISRAGTATSLVFGIGTSLSAQLLKKDMTVLRRLLKRWRRSVLYRKADAVVATSPWIADDLANHFAVPRNRLHVIGNPVVSLALAAQGAQYAEHRFFAEKVPVVISVGRLAMEKDFATLLHAFAALRARRDARLLVLGEGQERERLTTLAHALGIAGDVDFPGFVTNPFAWMQRAQLLTCSSLWEGFGNTLVEAMALGVPVVSTDCPGGPSFILDNGRYGRLVPVGDPASLADAMAQTLAAPTDPTLLAERAREFSVEAIARRYLALFKNLRVDRGLLPSRPTASA